MSPTAGSDPAQETYRAAFDDGYPHVSYGLSFSAACAKHVETTFHASRVYLIVSASLSRNTDFAVQLRDALGSEVVGVRYGITPHTPWSEILDIAQEARSCQADLLVTLGAGSLTDGAKVITLAIENKATTFDELEALYCGPTWFTPRPGVLAPSIPIISIPTSLSGGEYSHIGGATHDHTRRKYGFGAPMKGPALVILDPALTCSTPAHVWLQSGVRAVDHCVEGLCSLRATAESDACAGQGLRLLVPNLLRTKADPEDLDARAACQMGVIEATKTVFQFRVPMGASHGIGHQLGPLGVGHGETSCVLLPAVCKYNVSANRERQGRVSKILWEEAEVAKVFNEAGLSRDQSDLGDLLDVIIATLGMPRSLKAVGVGDDQFDKLAEHALGDHWCQSNPRSLTETLQVMEILHMVRG